MSENKCAVCKNPENGDCNTCLVYDDVRSLNNLAYYLEVEIAAHAVCNRVISESVPKLIRVAKQLRELHALVENLNECFEACAEDTMKYHNQEKQGMCDYTEGKRDAYGRCFKKLKMILSETAK